jgi:hypothetical protein
MWSSTLVADGKVYVGSLRGDFWTLAAGRELKVHSRVELGEPIHATPTAANGVLYVGTKSRLFALATPAAETRSPQAPKAGGTE